MANQVLIEFIVDTTQLESAIDVLEKIGQIDAKTAAGFKQANAEINKQSAAIKATAAAAVPLKKNLEDVSKATKSMTTSFMQGFEEGVMGTLKEAGVSLEEFLAALKNGPQAAAAGTESLRQRLKNLTQQIAELKLAGQDNTEQFKQMVKEAGNIRDAMQDAGAEIKNAGSDTRSLDNLLGAAQAVAGGFAVAQGAAALFGDESEELQKTLLKVNAAMAILQGLQSIGNAVQKEGAIVQLFSNKQRIITNAQLAVENGLQSTSVVVRLAAAAAQRILNAAMAANPILLFISALILVVSAMAAYINSSKEAEIQTGQLNDAVEDATAGFEAYATQIKQQSERATSELEKNGALQSEILKRQLKAEQDINQKRAEDIARLRKVLTTSRKADEKERKAAEDRLAQLTKDRNEADTKEAIDKNNLDKRLREENIKAQIAAAETALLLAKKGSQSQFQIQKQLIDLRAKQDLNAAGLTEDEKTNILAKAVKERQDLELKSISAFAQARVILSDKNTKEELNARIAAITAASAVELANVNLTEGERAKIIANTQKEVNDLIFDFEKIQLANAKAAIDAKLESVKEGTKDELNFRIEQAKIEAAIELKEQGISAEKRLLIETQLAKKIQELRVNFFNKLSKDVLTIESAGNAARIANLKTSDQERFNLQLENIEIERVMQLAAAKGNAAEEIRINAEADQKILETKRSAIDAALEYELRITAARTGALRRANDIIAADEKKSIQKRIDAIDQLAALDIADIHKRQDALEDQLRQGLISQKDYNAQYEELKDKELEIDENAARKKKQLLDDAALKGIATAVQIAGQLADIYQSISDTQTQKDNDRIAAEKERVAALLESGAITEAEANKRNKRIEAEEKKAKAAQAKREKELAVFRAFLAIPSAYLNGLSQSGGNPIVGAIYAAIAAVEAGIIASRPIPKFRTGKKDQYEGPGIIGEAGQEIFEHAGKRYLAKKETLVWLGKQDKVYNPTETKEMLMPVVDKQVMQWQPSKQNDYSIDYDKLGKVMAKELRKMPGTNINIDEYGLKVWVQEGNARTNYMDKRYSSK